MRKSTLRAFGIGLFLAGVFAFFYDQIMISDDQNTKAKPQQETPVKAEKTPVTDKPDKAQVATPTKKEVEPKVEQKKPEPSEPKPQATGDVIYQLKVYSGATPTSIAADLQSAGIVENKEDMAILLASEKYARSIQVGVYNITDTMTLEDIAIMITN